MNNPNIKGKNRVKQSLSHILSILIIFISNPQAAQASIRSELFMRVASPVIDTGFKNSVPVVKIIIAKSRFSKEFTLEMINFRVRIIDGWQTVYSEVFHFKLEDFFD
jgi:hypothetical protein